MSQPDRASPPPKILVVDDEPKNRRLLAALLSPEGYEVLQAGDGVECLEVLGRTPCDLVLLDYLMPEMDGVEACRRIRASEHSARIPVVFVTALTDRDSRIRGKEVGADDFLTKPVDEIELLVRVKTLLEVKAYHDLRDQQTEWLEQELERRTTQLIRAERLATLGTLAGGVGHELNNIATIHVFALAAIRARAQANAPADEKDLAALARAGEHIELHGTNLLELGRPGPDRTEAHDLRAVVRETVKMLASVGRTKRVEVELDLPPEPVRVTVSRARVEQILINLIGNAADALKEVDRWPKTVQVSVEVDAESRRVVCQVADNGPGIPADVLDSIFEPYFTTKPPGKGTGLGLSVVKQILEGYAGELRLENRPGEGCTFSFDLPLAAEGP